MIVFFFLVTFSTPHFSLSKNHLDNVNRGYNDVNTDYISKKIPKTSSCENGDNIDAIFDRKLYDYDNSGYFPQVYESSLQATYYGLYILEALGKLDHLNQTRIVDYILDHYSEDLQIFLDAFTLRYLNMNFPQKYYPLSSMLEIHCYAILSLDILGRLDLINPQESINFIWSCLNPEGDENGFIGRPYDDELVNEFKVATMDNTYFALSTLNLFIDNWAGYGFYLNRIVPYINSLQSISGYDWFFGSFLNDNDLMLDTLGSPLYEPNLLSSYYAVKSLQILNLVDTVRTHEFHTFLGVIYDEQEVKFQVNDISNALDIVATPIGLELSDITGFSNYSRTEALQFVMNNRNTLGNWDRSTVYKYHELIDTFQIIRSLKEIGEISQLTELEKE
jgi:prenyltransferase beta subunit